jgi:5'-methylthioadenosine phosphorylase
MLKIGIIGGSGLDNPDILKNIQEKEIKTPYGKPSSSLKCGEIEGVEVVLLARHGREHTIPPTQVNNRANIFALKEVGCTHILTTTAVGSLREEIGRGDFVIIDQFIDFTRKRELTFHDSFEAHKPVHTPMAEPFNFQIRKTLIYACEKESIKHHKTGTVLTIEGPRFSTKAESKMFRLWGADIINMSIAPEAILANELAIPYASLAMSTDYDCWKEDEEPVSWDEILKVFAENVEKVKRVIIEAVKKLKQEEQDKMPK